jgi:hypothetical protein
METSRRLRQSLLSCLLSSLSRSSVKESPSLAQTKGGSIGEQTASIISKLDAAATKEFQEAWHASHNGLTASRGWSCCIGRPTVRSPPGRRAKWRAKTLHFRLDG